MEHNDDERRSGACGQATQIILRLLALGSMGVAWAIMFFSEETEDIGGRANYQVSPALMYVTMAGPGELGYCPSGANFGFPLIFIMGFFVYATGVMCLYCMATIPMVFYFYKNRFVFVLDMTVMALAMASASTVTAVGYVAEFGNEAVAWLSVCGLYKSYCSRAVVSVAFSYLGFVCLLVICATRALCPDPPTTSTKTTRSRTPPPSLPASSNSV